MNRFMLLALVLSIGLFGCSSREKECGRILDAWAVGATELFAAVEKRIGRGTDIFLWVHPDLKQPIEEVDALANSLHAKLDALEPVPPLYGDLHAEAKELHQTIENLMYLNNQNKLDGNTVDALILKPLARQLVDFRAKVAVRMRGN